MSDITETQGNWLSEDDLSTMRGKMPVIYINAIPVLTDDLGVVTHVGLLLRLGADGEVNREIVAGRVLFGVGVLCRFVSIRADGHHNQIGIESLTMKFGQRLAVGQT